MALDELRRMTMVGDDIIMVGGGARSAFRRQIFADVFEMTVLKTGIDQQAAALGAAALAFVGTGLWDGFERILALHAVEHRASPSPRAKAVYRVALEAFRAAVLSQAGLAKPLTSLRAASIETKANWR
jgi:xylulokinase